MINKKFGMRNTLFYLQIHYEFTMVLSYTQADIQPRFLSYNLWCISNICSSHGRNIYH